jgi:hypothetical protein
MAITDIDWGTVTLTNGSTAVTGSGTSWIADDIRDGDTFVFVDGGDGFQQPIVASVQSNTALTLRNAWEGPTLTATTYTLRYQWDSSRVSAMSRRLIMILDNGNIEAFAGLTGPGIAVFNGPHSMEIRPFSDFVNGVRFDVQVDTLADRDAYDGQTQGFTVLVSDMGDGRSAIFTKNSNTSGDWSDAAYITGPVGPLPEVEATVSMLPPGSTATVTEVPITGGVRLEFELPEASGFNFVPGGYDIGEAYDKDDVVTHNRSSFIALQSVPVGESPSSTFPPVDTAYWGVLVEAGQDGTGTGDVVGPSGAVEDRIAVFDGTTGKLIKDGGLTLAQLTPADGSVTNAKLADVPTATVKGRVAAGDGVPTDLTATQVLTLLKTVGAYAKDNILGTVSQASGVPTGAIIERGSNANGQYARFADGTQICWHDIAYSGLTGTVGAIFTAGSFTWTYPVAFLSGSNVVCQAHDTSSSIIWCGYFAQTTLAYIQPFCYAPVSGSRGVNAVVLGRWF